MRVMGVDTYWPRLARIAGPTAIALVVGTAGCGDSGSSETADTTEPVAFASLVDAVEAAGVEIAGVSDGDVEELIEQICDDTTSVDQLAESVAAIVDEPSNARQVIEGAGDGAEIYCPDAVAGSPDLLQDSYTAAVALLAAQQPPATEPPTTIPVTTAPPPPPPPTTTTAPPAPPPPPPPTTGVYYENCTAARNAGAAPVHRGEPGYGKHLDRDGDGVGCES